MSRMDGIQSSLGDHYSSRNVLGKKKSSRDSKQVLSRAVEVVYVSTTTENH